MRRLLRRPAHATVVAYLALFVALGGSAMAAFVVSSNSQIGPNTIYGAVKPSSANDNIVDGSISPSDIAASSLGGGRIKDGSLTGADLAASSLTGSRIQDGTLTGADLGANTLSGTQINESTLARVPDSAALGGVAAAGFRRFQWTSRQSTSSCSEAQIWHECAVYTVTVPAGHHYVITITSTINANPGNITGAQVLACPSTDGPSCTRSQPERADFPANLFTSWTTATTNDFFSGTYRFNTGMKWNINVPASTEGQTTTTVLVYDFSQEGIG
jgi:uncharacterized protein YjbI with pentapeptide repeats